MSELAIINRVLDGDVEAFSRLVDLHYDRCARIAMRIVGNREDAEEALQDAFLRAFKALGDYEERERFSAWLTRIVVNQCRTVLARDAPSRGAVPGCRSRGRVARRAREGTDGEAWPELEHALAHLPATSVRRSCFATRTTSPTRRWPESRAPASRRSRCACSARSRACAPCIPELTHV